MITNKVDSLIAKIISSNANEVNIDTIQTTVLPGKIHTLIPYNKEYKRLSVTITIPPTTQVAKVYIYNTHQTPSEAYSVSDSFTTKRDTSISNIYWLNTNHALLIQTTNIITTHAVITKEFS